MGYWRNPPVPHSERYVSGRGEHLANIFTQLFSIVVSLVCWLYVLVKVQHSTKATLIFFFHGLAYIIMFTVSMQFHIICLHEWGTKRMLRWHMYDRLVIYFIIAAGYTPWLTIPPLYGFSGEYMWWMVWAIGGLGAVYSMYLLNWSKFLETVIYIAYGVMPFYPLYTSMVSGIEHILYGGFIIIVIGIPAFKMDGHMPCAHAFWHVCVSVGSLWHCWAAYHYLSPLTLA